MVTTINSSHSDAANSDGEGRLPLDELFLLLKNSEHTPSTDGDMLIYVHEKPRCYNMCEKGTGIKRAGYKKALEAKLMVSNEINQGGKSFVC
jgi:hypothetical protein